MIFASLVFSAVAVFLGVFTKLPQGGGGLVNNFMVMSYFLPSPPLLRPPPPRAIYFDLYDDILETREYYVLHPTTISNVTHGPMPRPDAKPRPTAASSSPFSPPNATFTIPIFLLSLQISQLCSAIGEILGNIAMFIMMLYLPWLAALQMHLRGRTVTARKAAGKPVAGLGDQSTLKPRSQLLAYLQILISERDEALAELVQAKEQAKEAEKGAMEAQEAMQEMEKQRDDALEGLVRGKESLKKLEKEKEEEAKRLKREIEGQVKAWKEREREKEEEAKGLKGEIERQVRAWEKREREWEEERARGEKKSQEDKDSLRMGREREKESWKGEVERLELRKAEEEERMGRRMKKERDGWTKEKEGWEKEKEGWEREKEGWEREKEEERKAKERIEVERKSLEEANDRAVRRIVELEEEVRRLDEERGSRSGGGEEGGQRTPRSGNRRGLETPRGGAGGSPWGKPHWRPPGK